LQAAGVSLLTNTPLCQSISPTVALTNSNGQTNKVGASIRDFFRIIKDHKIEKSVRITFPFRSNLVDVACSP
jgi:hypothetical protein